jgi:hypothetical protein
MLGMQKIRQLAARQYGLITRRQWLDAGLGPDRLKSRVAAGEFVRVYPGVFRLSGAPASFQQDVMAACLATGGVASNRCAAYLWGMRRFERKVIEVLVVRGHAPHMPEVEIRRTASLHRLDRTTVGRIPVTSRARTLLDLADCSFEHLESALNGVLSRHPAELGRLDRLLRREGRGKAGSGRLRHLVDQHLAGRRPTESELEDDLIALLRRYGLSEPVPQHEVNGRRIDIAYPELEFGIEADSVEAHSAREDVQRNATKANDLLGWWILHFTWDDIHGRPAETAAQVQDALFRRRVAAA